MKQCNEEIWYWWIKSYHPVFIVLFITTVVSCINTNSEGLWFIYVFRWKRRGGRKSLRDIYRRDILRKNKHDIFLREWEFPTDRVKKKNDSFPGVSDKSDTNRCWKICGSDCSIDVYEWNQPNIGFNAIQL